jgi:hypothetical protein
LISDGNSFPSSETLRTVSSIIPRPHSPQTHFRDFGRRIAGNGRAVDDAVDFDDYLGSSWDYASGIQNVVGAIAELLEEGFAPEVVELSEYALARIEGARAYDVDGTLLAAFSKGWRSSLTKPASGRSRTRRRWRNGSSSGSWAATTIRSSTQ